MNIKNAEFNEIPFINAKGYHNKTIAYFIWHIFRIEDIVAHTLISQDEQVFFLGDYQNHINTSIMTTGNELLGEQIAHFSEELNIDELYRYAVSVKNRTDEILKNISYADLKRKITDIDKEKVKALQVVSENKNAYWLKDYWCGKDVKGLIQMPFSRHWIMHIEACLRIKNKMLKSNTI